MDAVGLLTSRSSTIKDVGFTSDHRALAEDALDDSSSGDGLDEGESGDGADDGGGELHVCGGWLVAKSGKVEKCWRWIEIIE